jgi:hypothetical protein
LDVVIIETSEDYTYSGITEPFVAAGVHSVTSILIKDSFIFPDDAAAQEVAKALQLKGTTKDEIQKQLLKSFSNTLVSGKNLQVLQYLKDHKMIEYTGDLSFPIDRIIIAGGRFTESKEVLDKIEIPMINTVESSNIPVMAVEKINVAHSSIPDYRKLRISTVDNVDTIIGKTAMLMVVSGQEGHFGEKDTAEQLMPEEFITVE